jgi:hypothetical protein
MGKLTINGHFQWSTIHQAAIKTIHGNSRVPTIPPGAGEIARHQEVPLPIVHREKRGVL